MKSESYEAIAAKAAPAIGYIGATLWGLSIPDWAALLACVYTILLIVQMLFRFANYLRNRRAARLAIEAAGKPSDYGDGGL